MKPLSNKDAIAVLEYAKENTSKHNDYAYLCNELRFALREFKFIKPRNYDEFLNFDEEKIREFIPVFTREFCEAEIKTDYCWWERGSKPRVRALDKMINFYKEEEKKNERA